MRYFSSLYVDEKSNKILHKKHLLPKKGRVYTLPLLCVYFPEKGSRMEYTEVKNLKPVYFKNHMPLVVGFASTPKTARDIMLNIIEATYKEDDSLDYRKLLESRNAVVDRFNDVTDFVIVPEFMDSDTRDKKEAKESGKGKSGE